LDKIFKKFPRNIAPIVVVVDGLDEYSDAGAQTFLQALLRRFERLDHPVQLRFILFSRSETHIGIPIDQTTVQVSRLELHNVPHSIVNNDIRKYVETGLAQMSREKAWGNEWYTSHDINLIAAQADILFIYASTVLKYLANSKFPPLKRLEIVRGAALPTKSGALRSLYIFYALILENLGEVDDLEPFEVDLIRNILSSSLGPFTLVDISELLNWDLEYVQACLQSLSSVIFVSHSATGKLVQVLHASFPEFLLSSSPHTPAHLRLDIGSFHGAFTLRCLDILKVGLREHPLGSYMDRSIDRIRSPIVMKIRPSLQYAARYWLTHISKWEDETTSREMVLSLTHFIDDGYLLPPWIECLAWTMNLRTFHQAVDSFTTLQVRASFSRSWGLVSQTSALYRLCHRTSGTRRLSLCPC